MELGSSALDAQEIIIGDFFSIFFFGGGTRLHKGWVGWGDLIFFSN